MSCQAATCMHMTEHSFIISSNSCNVHALHTYTPFNEGMSSHQNNDLAAHVHTNMHQQLNTNVQYYYDIITCMTIYTHYVHVYIKALQHCYAVLVL